MFDDIRLRPLCANGQECPECGGTGWVVEVRPTCCGNFYPHGDCRGYCAVPEQFQAFCPTCGGHGELPGPETIPQRNARLNLTNWRPRAEEAK